MRSLLSIIGMCGGTKQSREGTTRPGMAALQGPQESPPANSRRCGDTTSIRPSAKLSTNPSSSQTPAGQPRNPLHGITLEGIVTALVAHYGWAELGQRIPVRCFISDPSVASSLKFLRKTPWAREKVEGLYLFMLRDLKRSGASQSSST